MNRIEFPFIAAAKVLAINGYIADETIPHHLLGLENVFVDREAPETSHMYQSEGHNMRLISETALPVFGVEQQTIDQVMQYNIQNLFEG